MTMQLSQIAAAYVRSINGHNVGAFDALFADGAVVNDEVREFRGRAAIKASSDREISDAQVTLELVDVTNRGGETRRTACW